MTRTTLEIAAILVKHWDPIGVSDVAEAQDEYGPVAERLSVLLARGASRQQIAALLLRYETDDLGLTPKPEKAETVADLLVIKA